MRNLKTFWLRPHYLLAIALIWICFMPLMFAQRDPYNVIIKVTDLAQTVITNTEKLKDLDRQVTAIHEWILAHDRQQLINIEITSGEMHDIKTKLDQHDKILWALVMLVGTILIKLAMDFLELRKKKTH